MAENLPQLKPHLAGRSLRAASFVRQLLRPARPAVAVPDSPASEVGLLTEVAILERPASRELAAVFAGVERFNGLGVYVHGSWADDTRTPFSDLDDLILVERERIRDPRACRELEEWLNLVDLRFARLDPLQHHGHWLRYDDQLTAYDESYLPLTVLADAIRIAGPERLSVRIDSLKTRVGLRRNLAQTLANLAALFAQYSAGEINCYAMKGLVGSVLLLPAYGFQLRGERLGKREAIERAAELLPPAALELLNKCSRMRAEWAQVTALPGWRRLRWAAGWFDNAMLWRRFARRFAPRFPRAAFPQLEPGEVESFARTARSWGDGPLGGGGVV